MTDGSIEFIERHLKSTDKVLEFGGGWSSLWWAARAAWTLTVEADYAWAAKILTEMARHPALMTKWSLRFVACEWSNNFSRPKAYWTKHANLLTPEIADRLETEYFKIDFAPDIIVIDGSARVRNVQEVDKYVSAEKSVRMIVVDNMEWLARFTEGRFLGFTRHEFHEYDLQKIPAHQNGKWMTAVWTR